MTEDDITPSADKHGIPHADTLHAYRLSWRRLPTARANVVMVIGPDRTGALLEVGVVVEAGQDLRIIHSMPCRPQFLPRPRKKR